MNAKNTITISGICFDNAHSINDILSEIGCANMHNYVNDVTAVVVFNSHATTKDEVAITIGRLVMNGFAVSFE